MDMLLMVAQVLVQWVIRTACRTSISTSTNTSTNTNTNINLSIKLDLRQVNHKARGNIHSIRCITFIIRSRSRRTSFIPEWVGISEDRAKAENLGEMRDDDNLVETCFEFAK